MVMVAIGGGRKEKENWPNTAVAPPMEIYSQKIIDNIMLFLF